MIKTNNSNLEYNSLIKSQLKAILSNREDSSSYRGWGTSVVIGLYNTNDITIATDYIVIDDHNFIIYDKDDYNIYVNMQSEDSTPISFMSLRDKIVDEINLNDTETRLIRNNELYITSDTLKVKIRNITLPNSIEFSDLYLKYGIKNKYYIYGLSSSDYASVSVDRLSNINFDIVLDSDDEDIILSNLKLIQKKNNELIFKIDTNINDLYVYVDTDIVENNYAIYPDITFSANTFINISNRETPILFDGQKTGYFINYETENRTGIESNVYRSLYCKPVSNSIDIYKYNSSIFDKLFLTNKINEFNNFCNIQLFV